MFAPIFPNPTIPSCMVPPVLGLSNMICEGVTGDWELGNRESGIGNRESTGQ